MCNNGDCRQWRNVKIMFVEGRLIKRYRIKQSDVMVESNWLCI